MSDRTWVSVDVTTLASNGLDALEDAVFKNLCDGNAIPRNSPQSHIDMTLQLEDESTYGDVVDGRSMNHYHYGQSSVTCGYMATAAMSVVELMRAGFVPKRSFAAEEDGYSDYLGWRFEYDAATDRVVEGSAQGGQFQIGLDDLIRWYNDANRDGNALMRMVIDQFNVKLKRPASPVIALIERINQQHI